MKKPVFLLLLAIASLSLSAQPAFEIGQTITDYVESVFQGPGVQISNVMYNGHSGDSISVKVGTFQNNGSYLEIDEGLVMSTGAIMMVHNDGNTYVLGERNTIGELEPLFSGEAYNDDPDLELLVAPNPLGEVTVIEFDFVPAFDNVSYQYQFGSEEYPEFVNTFYNDLFGFFIAGPGIDGEFSIPEGYTSMSANVALLPDGVTFVSINNVNDGTYSCPSEPSGCANCEYYINQCDIDSIAFAGMTTPLETYLTLIPGEQYHLKLAIADVGDYAFDSAIFLRQNSFMSAPPLSVSDLMNEELLVANPIEEELLFTGSMTDVSQVALYTISGVMVVNEMNFNGVRRLDVSGLDQGIYILEVTDVKGRKSTQRVVKVD